MSRKGLYALLSRFQTQGGVGGRGDDPDPSAKADRPCPRRESATDVRLHGDEMAADADDGDAGDVLT
jgi:hypothetical protein